MKIEVVLTIARIILLLIVLLFIISIVSNQMNKNEQNDRSFIKHVSSSAKNSTPVNLGMNCNPVFGIISTFVTSFLQSAA